ncbi:TPA: hypothetical protein ACH3X1_008358 [Trebouxia sp. C0004]
MARFASEEELETFLGRLDPDYSRFAAALCQNGVRKARQLANATKPLLLSYGLPELYIDDIKATADRTGMQTGVRLTGEQAVQLAEFHEDLIERRSVNISDVNSSKWEEVRASSKLEMKVWEKPFQPSHELKTADKVPPFGWTNDLERTQADRYGPHIQSCISTPRNVQWIDAANSYPKLLETGKCSSLPFALKGSTDYAAVTRASVRARLPITGLKALFELKKAISSGTVYQAMVQLLVANIHTPSHQPVMVHTDLCDEWHILWMDGNILWTYTPATRFEAVAMVEDIFNTPVLSETSTSSAASISEDTEGMPRVLKRRRFLQPEGGNIPCAQLTDLAGMLPEDEYKAALLESVLQQFCSIPAIAAMRVVPAGMYC